jgi:hypothetical protein
VNQPARDFHAALHAAGQRGDRLFADIEQVH